MGSASVVRSPRRVPAAPGSHPARTSRGRRHAQWQRRHRGFAECSARESPARASVKSTRGRRPPASGSSRGDRDLRCETIVVAGLLERFTQTDSSTSGISFSIRALARAPALGPAPQASPQDLVVRATLPGQIARQMTKSSGSEHGGGAAARPRSACDAPRTRSARPLRCAPGRRPASGVLELCGEPLVARRLRRAQMPRALLRIGDHGRPAGHAPRAACPAAQRS